MDEKEQQFAEYWKGLRAKGKNHYIRRNMMMLVLVITPIVTLIRYLQGDLKSTAYVVGFVLFTILWNVLVGYGLSLWLWSGNERRYKDAGGE